MRYEKKVIEYLQKRFAERVLHGPWLEYFDEEGRGLAQPDAVIVSDGWVVVVEAKRTFVSEAMEKLERFYLPLAKEVWPGRAAYGVQVCMNLTPEAKAFPWLEPWRAPAAQPLHPVVHHWSALYG